LFSSVSLGERLRLFSRDRFFFYSLASVLVLNFIAVTLTWFVVFSWNAGYEYSPVSLWQLSSFGPVITLVVTQLTLTGVFLMVKIGLSRIGKQRHNAQSYSTIARVVLSVILAIIAVDALNDISNFLVLMHIV
jgi:hypothetical protein